jgi:hypothetical protein
MGASAAAAKPLRASGYFNQNLDGADDAADAAEAARRAADEAVAAAKVVPAPSLAESVRDGYASLLNAALAVPGMEPVQFAAPATRDYVIAAIPPALLYWWFYVRKP